MNFRLWYPQLDVYDAIRRMSVLTCRWVNDALSEERLMIVDFYLANPPLLYLTHMPNDIRQRFNELSVTRPEKSFLSYPATKVLFHRMEPIQNQALQTLVGKGLLNIDQYKKGVIYPSQEGAHIMRDQLSNFLSDSEQLVATFLVSHFGRIGLDDIHALRRSTGLRRVAQ